MKRTRPVGTEEDEPTIVAVNVTALPSTAGFAEEATVAVVERFLQLLPPTACTSTPEIAGGAVALPRYRAVMA